VVVAESDLDALGLRGDGGLAVAVVALHDTTYGLSDIEPCVLGTGYHATNTGDDAGKPKPGTGV
jgi:hypothetical protein